MFQMMVFPSPEGGVYRQVEQMKPTPRAGEVLVKVHASSVNRGEAQGVLKLKNPDAKPLATGIEFSGTIDFLGEGVVWVACGGRSHGTSRRRFCSVCNCKCGLFD